MRWKQNKKSVFFSNLQNINHFTVSHTVPAKFLGNDDGEDKKKVDGEDKSEADVIEGNYFFKISLIRMSIANKGL